MRIERDGIGTLDAGDAKGIVGGDCDERADAAIDVKPEVFFRRQARESLQIIDGAGVYRPGCSYDAGRLKSRRAILRDRLAARRCRSAVRHLSECVVEPGCPARVPPWPCGDNC